MYSETQAKVAPPNQVSRISFEWGETSVELHLYIEPLKKPHIKTTRRQFYRATVHTGNGRKQALQEEAPPISPTREADVQMVRYDNIRAEFTLDRKAPQVQLGKNSLVHLYSPRANAPIIVRARGLSIRLHTELSDGKEYLCATITPRKGKPRTLRRFLEKDFDGTPEPIVSIESGVMQPDNKWYLDLRVGAFDCLLDEEGGLILCEPTIAPSETDLP